MRLLLLTTLLVSLRIFNLSALEIKGIIISKIDNEAVSGVTVSIPLLSISTKSSPDGVFRLKLNDNISSTESILISIKSSAWQMVQPTTGEFITIRPSQRNHPLIIEVLNSSNRAIRDINKESPETYNLSQAQEIITERGVELVQVQVGANKKKDFSKKDDIENERIRIQTKITYPVRHLEIKYDVSPHKFLIADFFPLDKAMKVIKELKKKNIKAHIFKKE